MITQMPDFSGVLAKGGSEHRVIAIGDVHGRLDLLVALLQKIDALHNNDDVPTTLVFLGDYIDRGDDSRGVLEYLDRIAALGGSSKFLLGNHEEMLLSFLDDRSDGQLWMANGGLQTLASFGLPPVREGASRAELQDVRYALKERLGDMLEFLNKLELSWQWGDFLFSHAGIDPARGLNAQSPETLIWGHPDFCDHLRTDKICVVHGHYVTNQVHVSRSRIGVDTGAYFSGVLSAVTILHEEIGLLASS